MSLLATFVLAASTTVSGVTLPQCSWDKPGANPFMGDVVTAVDRYQDIPAATRAKIQARMKTRSYDDIAVIERDAIKGKAEYAPEIRDMHFGPGSICRTVTRTKWTASTQERGLVYCEDGHCILVPTVCRNVSRIKRLAAPRAIAPAQAVNVASATREEAPLEFEAPGAGPVAVPDAAPGSFAHLASTASPGLDLGGSPGPRNITIGGGQPLPPPGVPPLPPGRPTISSTPELPGNVPAVPEPSTWAMLVVGLLAVSAAARRKG
jgi:hypothetical protein